MDILFWLFIAILVIVGYNCFFNKTSQEGFIANPYSFIPTFTSDEKFEEYYNESIQDGSETGGASQPSINNSYVTNTTSPHPPAYNKQFSGTNTLNSNQGGLGSANLYQAGVVRNAVGNPTGVALGTNQGAVKAGLFNTGFEGVSNDSDLGFSPIEDIPLDINKGDGIVTELNIQNNPGAPSYLPNGSRQLTQKDLIPLDETTSTWAKLNPKPSGWLENKNFLQAGYHLGLNTVGQTKKNANYQLRSEPANPQSAVSPWNQSQIEPETRRCFDIN
jgi:hypothetical protein